MKPKTTYVMKFLNVLAWTVFIGLCIKAGAILYSFLISMFFNEIAASNHYNGLDLSPIKANSIIGYATIVLSIVTIYTLQALMFYTIIQIFIKINILSPFDTIVGQLIKRMSIISFCIGVLSAIACSYAQNFTTTAYQVPALSEHLGHGSTFLFFAGILYFIALLFVRGIELQTENDLTVS
jgi:hypothetical protein